MTALGIRYLTGHAVATSVTRERAEWPPHPGRVFMAMAAAYFETGGDAEERRALEWLEAQEPPKICASDCHRRSLVGAYVPANDKVTMPRRRQERIFPTVRPERDTVFLIWDTEAPSDLREALEKLCAKVTRIGHSSSLAQMWLAEGAATREAEWLPDELAVEGERFRTAERGSLQYLEREFNGSARAKYAEMAEALDGAKGKEKTQLKRAMATAFPEGEPGSPDPKLTRWAGYVPRRDERKPEEKPLRGFFDKEHVVVLGMVEGERLGLESTLQLTGALRNAAMNAAGGSLPELLSGHSADGNPSRRPHAAFFPLPFVEAAHADGHVLGLAIAIPREADGDVEVRRAIGALLFRESGEDRIIHLWKAPGRESGEKKIWDWRLQRSGRDEPRAALRLQPWTRASRFWASVTPVVLHHYPKKNRENDVADIVSEAFESAGLPRPLRVAVQPVSYFRGVGHALEMPEFSEGGKSLCRYQTHVVVEFERLVEGPVLVGRGRFRGYGLCRPVRSEDERVESD
jgi:CRISPR-associated protein Csb2